MTKIVSEESFNPANRQNDFIHNNLVQNSVISEKNENGQDEHPNTRNLNEPSRSNYDIYSNIQMSNDKIKMQLEKNALPVPSFLKNQALYRRNMQETKDLNLENEKQTNFNIKKTQKQVVHNFEGRKTSARTSRKPPVLAGHQKNKHSVQDPRTGRQSESTRGYSQGVFSPKSNGSNEQPHIVNAGQIPTMYNT